MASRNIVIKNNIRCFKSALLCGSLWTSCSWYIIQTVCFCSDILSHALQFLNLSQDPPLAPKALKTQFSHYIFEISNKVILLEITKLLRPFTGRNARKKSRRSG